MASEIAVDAIERQEWMAPVEEGLQNAVGRAYESAGGAGRHVKNFLHGTWLGHPLHPVLTDVPIGAWTAALVLDLMDTGSRNRAVGRGADAAIGVGLIGAVASAVTGLTDWHATDGPARRVGLTHGLMNVTATALYGTSWALRKKHSRRAGRILALAGYAIAAASAYLGGTLVYSKQIGVNHTAGEPLPSDFVPVLPDAELREAEPRRVEANGVKILLLRRGAMIYAIAEVCSHLGGPLAGGEVSGNTVRCPWHGSRFSLETGEVLDGPATHPQPCLETRVRDGQIEVRVKGNVE